MITETMRTEILSRLGDAEKEHEIKILYACESGSRAWGFASPDSDYDVRFIYVRPQAWYLSFDVETRRDVIEYPIVDEIDCGGWDIRKALYLFTRTNGALLEWLVSPINYIEKGTFRQQLAALAPEKANLTALCYHYSHMARSNAREHLFQAQVKLKKYFYVLRPLFAIRYIEAMQAPPPIEFRQLVDTVAPRDLVPIIDELLEIKMNAPEKAFAAPIMDINKFVETEFNRHQDAFKGNGRPTLADEDKVRDQLNTLFRHVIVEAQAMS